MVISHPKKLISTVETDDFIKLSGLIRIHWAEKIWDSSGVG